MTKGYRWNMCALFNHCVCVKRGFGSCYCSLDGIELKSLSKRGEAIFSFLLFLLDSLTQIRLQLETL